MAVAMRSRTRKTKPGETGPPRYECRTRGCTNVPQAEVDEIVRAAHGATWRDDMHQMITATREDDPEVRRLEAGSPGSAPRWPRQSASRRRRAGAVAGLPSAGPAQRSPRFC